MKRILSIGLLSVFGLVSTTAPVLAQDGWSRDNGANRAYYSNGSNYRNQRDQNYQRDQHAVPAYNYDTNRSYYANGYYNDRDRYVAPRGYYYGPDYNHHNHAGRDATIIGGSAAAGALIGAAAGHGEGAAIGAIVGGIAGVIADQAVRHDHHR